MRLMLLALVLLLAGCFPAAGTTGEAGPWAGCTTSRDGTSIACPYPPLPRGSPTPVEKPVIYSGPEPSPDRRGPAVPIPAPERPQEPLEPLPAPSPDPRPTPPPEPPAEPPNGGECSKPERPGHGHGDPNHCHTGPPGTRR